MLKLQHKKISLLWSSLCSSSERIVATCLIASFIIHTIVLLALLLTMHEQPLAVFLSSSIDTSNIVLVPLAKSMNQLSAARTAVRSTAGSQTAPIAPTAQKAPISPVPTANMAANSSGTFLTPMVNAKNKKQTAKEIKNKKTKKELLQEKRAAQQVALAQKKNQIKETKLPSNNSAAQSKKHVSEQKPVSPTPQTQQPVKQTPTPLATQASVQTHSSNNVSSESAQVDEQIYVGLQEWQALQVAQEIQEGIRNAWRPPAGIAPEAVCTILVTVGAHGAVTDATVQQSSGALIYDIAARNSIYTITFPRAAYNKQVIITFDR